MAICGRRCDKRLGKMRGMDLRLGAGTVITRPRRETDVTKCKYNREDNEYRCSEPLQRFQGGATSAEYTSGPITLTIPAQSGDQIRAFGKSPPGSVPYTLTVKFDTMLWGRNFYTAGIYIIDSSGKLLTLSYQTNTAQSTPLALSISHWNSTSSFNSGPKTVEVSESRTLWFRVTNDGTNWTFYVSHNGADWVNFYSEGITSFLGSTISSLGVYGDNNDTATIRLSSLVSIWSFELASGSGTNSSW